MRLLIDGTVLEYPPSGIARVLSNLYAACENLCLDLDVCLLHQQPLLCSFPESTKDWRVGSFVSRQCWRQHVLPTAAFFFGKAIHFPWNGNVPKMPHDITVVVTVHDVLPLEIPGYFETSQAREDYSTSMQTSLSRTHLLLTDSEYSKRQILKWFQPLTEPQVIYPASTLGYASVVPEIDRSTLGPIFLYSGGYHPRKGLVPLLRVFLELHSTGRTSARLILTGDRIYFSPELESLIKRGRETGAVEELGFVSDEHLARLYQQALALVYPSKFEGFGLPPLEAMALGCPVITCRASSIPEVCGDAALYVDPADEAGFAEALANVSANKNLRDSMREKGLLRAKMFRWEDSATRFLQAIGQTIDKRRGRQ